MHSFLCDTVSNRYFGIELDISNNYVRRIGLIIVYILLRNVTAFFLRSQQRDKEVQLSFILNGMHPSIFKIIAEKVLQKTVETDAHDHSSHFLLAYHLYKLD